jgi:hypothetical protein
MEEVIDRLRKSSSSSAWSGMLASKLLKQSTFVDRTFLMLSLPRFLRVRTHATQAEALSAPVGNEVI